LILAAGSLPTLISGAPVPSFLSTLATRVASTPLFQERDASSSYTVFGGTGDLSDGWPAQNAWVSDFTTMFNNNKGVMSSSCAQFGVPNNSDGEINEISTAIQSVGASTGIDPRFILAIMMQESNGCVRAPTTNYGVVNPGLMQSHDGSGSCNNGGVQHPCPPTEIVQMIQDGTSGTSSGDGLEQILAGIGGTDVSMYYQAARIYNSGSIGTTTSGAKNLGAGIATHCYASDVANRLTGWTTAPSTCNQNSIADDNGTPVSGGDSSVSPVTVPTTAAAVPSVTIPTTAQAPTPTSAAEGGVFAATGTSVATVITSVSTALVVPTQAATSISTSTPAPAPAAATTASASSPASTPPTTTGSETAGSPCTEEGLFNCVGGTSFQQCGSGTWSVVQSLAAGTTCNPGQSLDLIISKPKRKRARSARFVEAGIPIGV